MKITKSQLKRIIRETFSVYADERPNNPMERAYVRKAVVNNYQAWVQEMGHITPSASSVLATYLVDQGLTQDAETIDVLSNKYRLEKTDLDHELKTQTAEAEAGQVDDDASFERNFYESKITKRQLRRIIRESLLVETEMLKIMDNPYEDLSVYNRIANYALTNNITGAMSDPEVNTDELYWELDEMRGWIDRVGEDDGSFSDDAVVPEGWDVDKVDKFLEDLESAWHKDQATKDHAAVAADPDKDWLKFMANEFQSTIIPNDLESLGWKEYKRYIRLSPPSSISHAVDEIHITNDDFSSGHSPGTREEFVEFLTKRAGKTLKKRKIYKSPPPMYD